MSEADEASLTDAERAALDELVFNMSGPHKLETVAQRLGLSHQYVGLIYRGAMTKLRKRLLMQSRGRRSAWI